MNLKETIELIIAIKEYYPHAKIEDAAKVAKRWYKHFNRFDYQDVANALEVYIESEDSEYPPTISKLKKLAANEKDEVLSAYDAFDMVTDAFEGDFYDNWQEFPDSIKRVLKSPKDLKRLTQMNQETLYTSYKNQFIREYTDKNRRKTPVGEYEPREITEDMIDRDQFKKAEIRVKNGTYLTNRDWEYMNYYGGFKRYKECKGRPIRLEEE